MSFKAHKCTRVLESEERKVGLDSKIRNTADCHWVMTDPALRYSACHLWEEVVLCDPTHSKL